MIEHTEVVAAKGQMRGDSGSVELGFSFGLTDQVARYLGNRDPAVFQANELVSLFSYRFTLDTQKRRRNKFPSSASPARRRNDRPCGADEQGAPGEDAAGEKALEWLPPPRHDPAASRTPWFGGNLENR